MAKNGFVKPFEFVLPDGSGRVLVLIENTKTQAYQVTLRKGKKRVFTANVNIELDETEKANSTSEKG